MALSDYIFVMKDGKIQQFGTPTDIYDEPVNRFVADFIGESNIVEGKMVEDFVVNIYGQDFECVDAGIPSGKKVEVVIRPEGYFINSIGQRVIQSHCRLNVIQRRTL